MDFDEVLNLEEQFYQEGFEEGRLANLAHNYLEGKQYGLQIGFQRFILIGLIEGFCNVIRAEQVSPSIEKLVSSIPELVDEIGLGNDELSVQVYERNIVKLKNKFRLLLLALNKQLKSRSTESPGKLSFEMVEKMAKTVAGELNSFVEDNEASVTTQTQTEMW